MKSKISNNLRRLINETSQRYNIEKGDLNGIVMPYDMYAQLLIELNDFKNKPEVDVVGKMRFMELVLYTGNNLSEARIVL